MLVFLGISTLASLLASSVLGIRLLRLARRTRKVPELLIGAAFIAAGVVGYVFMLAGTGGAEAMSEGAAHICFMIGYWLISAGVMCTYLFVWRVFHPASRSVAVFTVVASLLVGATALPIALPGLNVGEETAFSRFMFWLGHAVRVGSGAWGTFEAGRYFLALRRRMVLGLADPVVANRIFLWAMASLGSVVIFAATAVANGSGSTMEQIMSPALILLISTTTFSVATCQWFAFLPPRWYLAWAVKGVAAAP